MIRLLLAAVLITVGCGFTFYSATTTPPPPPASSDLSLACAANELGVPGISGAVRVAAISCRPIQNQESCLSGGRLVIEINGTPPGFSNPRC